VSRPELYTPLKKVQNGSNANAKPDASDRNLWLNKLPSPLSWTSANGEPRQTSQWGSRNENQLLPLRCCTLWCRPGLTQVDPGFCVVGRPKPADPPYVIPKRRLQIGPPSRGCTYEGGDIKKKMSGTTRTARDANPDVTAGQSGQTPRWRCYQPRISLFATQAQRPGKEESVRRKYGAWVL